MTTKISNELVDEVGQALQSGETFFLTTASPDGDSVGSMQALGLALKAKRKKPTLFYPEAVPDALLFLPGREMTTLDLPKGSFDALIVMDTGSSKLLFRGDRGLWKQISSRVINIDHHPDNDRFGDLNLVTSTAASTGELIYQVLKRLEWEITKEMALCLLTALMADTGAFRYPNVTPLTLQIASDLVALGADNGLIARKLYASYSVAYVKLLGRLFGNLKFEKDGKLGWSVLSREDYRLAEAPDDTADKMVEQLDVLKDIQAYALLREMEDGKIKISLRSRNNFPVNEIAAQFGGGGHKQAAGCQMTGNLKEAEQKILEGLRSLFK